MAELTEYQTEMLGYAETSVAVLVLGVSLVVFLLTILVVRHW